MNFIKEYKKWFITAATIVAAVILIATIAIPNISEAQNSIKANIKKGQNGEVIINTCIADLKENNIEFGDEVQLKFTSGYFADFVPILYGEYLNTGQHILKAKDDQSELQFVMQNFNNLWDNANLKDDHTVSIKLVTKHKYIDLNKAFTMPELPNVSNIRSLKGGNLKYLSIFRGASSNTPNAEINFSVNAFKKNLNINYVSDLSSLGISFIDLKNPQCNYTIIDEMKRMSSNESKCYICSDKDDDATAYYCALIEAIAGASYEEIVNDYMETYKNRYGITKEAYPKEYEAIKNYKIDKFLKKLTKTPNDYDLSQCNMTECADFYLRAFKTDEDEIDLILKRISR